MSEWRDIATLIFDVCLLAAVGIVTTLVIVDFVNLWR